MPYNVDTWKTKELSELRVPLASFYKHAREDWHPERTNEDDGSVTLSVMESQVRGALEGDTLSVTSIEAQGEGSGTALAWIIEPALKESTGKLVAVRVWEGGDSIDRLTVVDGDLTSETVEL